ncbi:MAG: site-2 protease family protein, partial [Flavobacteriales bacterium]
RDIILLPIGGVARMDKLPEKPSQEISVAAAGPAVNFLLAAITYLFFLDKKDLDFSQLLTSVDAGNWMLHFFFANIYLALFNLLPAFPMDGGRILRGLLSLRFGRIKATWWSARIGQVVALIMFITGLMGSPLLCFIAVFVFLGAQLEAQSTDQQRLLKGVKVSQVMMDRLETIPAGSILRTVSEQLLSSDAVKFIVLQDGQPAGHLDRQDLLDAIGRYGQDVFVDAIM